MTENEIEDAVWQNVTELGYDSASAVRNVRIGPEQGQVDLALFPRIGKKKIILVEAKRSAAEDAKSKVIGQIIMYLTGALQLSLGGIRLYRNYARQHPEKARGTARTSPKQIAGAASAKEAWELLCKGTPVMPDEIALYIATDGPPGPQLKIAVELLSKRYKLHIGLIQASKRGIQVIKKCP